MDRRAHYLGVALRLFMEHGFNGVSMDQLVSAAGGSKATLYRYFDSKERLFEAIIDDLSDSTAPPPADLHFDDVDLEDGLRILGRATARAAMDQRAIVLFRLAMGEHARFPNLGVALFEHGPAVGYRRFRDFVAAKQAAGEIEVADHQIAAEQFLGAIVGHQQLRVALGVSHATTDEMDARVETAIKLFVAAYRTTSAETTEPTGRPGVRALRHR